MNKILQELLKSLFEIAVIIAVFYFLFWPVKIDGRSMEDTFQSGDRVVFCKIMAMANMINRQDIVVVKMAEAGKEVFIIKRVIAVEGDFVKVIDGDVYVNNLPLTEDYKKGYTHGNIELTIPEGFIYVLGDNRDVSRDSRLFGPVAMEKVQGKVLLRLYPFNHIHLY